MFGLMKNAGCQNPGQPEWYRLHYCGLCKSIGSKYDQKSRLLLNYDTVFLAEILSMLASEDTARWDDKIKGYRCLALPKKERLPISLDYASDVNMLLAQIKVRDNQIDDLPILWEFVEKTFRKSFNKIQPLLDKWQVDESILRHWLKENQQRETLPRPSNLKDWQQALTYYAAPTAHITAYFFSQGGDAIGQPDAKEKLYALGYQFGELIYSLDAVKDYPEDQEAGAFNPLADFFGSKRDQQELFKTSSDFLWELSAKIESTLITLPISESLQKALCGRLVLNLSASISGQSTSCQTTSTGIEKSTLPRFSRYTGAILAQLNPAYPGRFSLSYLFFLFLFFSNKLFASVKQIAQHEMAQVDWAFISAAVAIPLLAYHVGKKVKKWRLLVLAKRLKQRIKTKMEQLKQETGMEVNWILVLLLILLVLLILLIVVLNKCASTSGECCQSCGSECNG